MGFVVGKVAFGFSYNNAAEQEERNNVRDGHKPMGASEKSTMAQNFEIELMPPRTAVGDTSVGTMSAPIFKFASESANGRVF